MTEAVTFELTWGSAWQGGAESRTGVPLGYVEHLREDPPSGGSAILARPCWSGSGLPGDTADLQCCVQTMGTTDR